MLDQLTLPGFNSAISSPARDCGPLRCVRQELPMVLRCGPVPVLASLSARQADAMGLLTKDTYGPTGFGSSASASLAASLANKSQARTELAGSILFKLTWKQRDTPAGQKIGALRATGRRISASASGSALRGWPTPTVKAGAGGEYKDQQKLLARVLGPHSNDLRDFAQLAGWPTPNAGPQNDTDSKWQARREAVKAHRGNGNGFGLTLGMASTLASWPTPTTRDFKDGTSSTSNVPTNALLGRVAWKAGPMRRTTSGELQIGSTAGTISGGLLNPEHSRWLMGFPKAWAQQIPGWQDWQNWQA